MVCTRLHHARDASMLLCQILSLVSSAESRDWAHPASLNRTLGLPEPIQMERKSMRTLIEVDPADGPAELQSKYHAGSCAKPGGQIRVHSQGKGFRGFGIC